LSDYLDLIDLHGEESEEVNWFLNLHGENNLDFLEFGVTIKLVKEFSKYKETHELVKEIPKIIISDDF